MITIRRSEYEQMLKHIEELQSLVKHLQEEIALLKRGRDSSTSSTAPSQDIGRSNSNSLRRSSGKKSGGQPGHEGHHLSMSAHPTKIEEHLPARCSQCGESLENVSVTDFTRRQVLDIPPVFAEYVEHRCCQKQCPVCGQENTGVCPEGVTSPIQYGERIKSVVSYLSVYQYIPYKRMRILLKDLFGVSISEGSIDNILEEMSNRSETAYNEIRKRIEAGEVVGSDETGCRVNGKKHWFHVWQNNFLTFIVSFASRGHKVIEEYFPEGFLESFYVSDCWASQLKVKAKRHQLCIAHLLRELLNFEKSLNSAWSIKMKDFLYRTLELKRILKQEDYSTAPAQVIQLENELDELLSVNATEFHVREQALINRLMKHRHSILTFLYYQNVPPDNNASERAIRNVKVKTKVSGQFRNSDGKGADRFARIRSIIDTAIKNGQDVFYALTCLAKCHETVRGT